MDGDGVHQRIVGTTIFVVSLFLLAHVIPSSVMLPLVAVTEGGEGIITDLIIEVRPGSGRALSEIVPPLELNTQRSLEAAISAAEVLEGVSFADRDIIFTFDTSARSVTGPSAGLPAAVGLAAIIRGRTPRDDVVLTGSIEVDGDVQPVGGLLRKAQALAHSSRTMVVPRGQGTLIAPLPLVIGFIEHGAPLPTGSAPAPTFVDHRATVLSRGLSSMALAPFIRDHYGVELKEAGTLREAVDIALEGEVSPRSFGQGDITTVLEAVAMAELKRAKEAFYEVRDLNGTQPIQERIDRADDLLARGYRYPAASEAFRAVIDIKVLHFREELDNRTDTERRQIVLDRVRTIRRDAAMLEQYVGAAPLPPLRMELIVFAQQRLMWAEYFLSLIVTGMGESIEVPTDELFAFYVMAAEEWVHGATVFHEHAKTIEPVGKPRDLESHCADLMESARTGIITAQNFGVPDLVGADRFYLASRLEEQKGWTVASCFDAASSYATTEALSTDLNDLEARARTEVNTSFKPTHLSGFINQEYALLSLEEVGNGTGNALDAILFARRAVASEELALQIAQGPPSIQAPVQEPEGTPSRSLKLIAAVNITFLLLGFMLWFGESHGGDRRHRDQEPEHERNDHRSGELLRKDDR